MEPTVLPIFGRALPHRPYEGQHAQRQEPWIVSRALVPWGASVRSIFILPARLSGFTVKLAEPTTGYCRLRFVPVISNVSLL
jgi:hypothetical protein